MAEFDAARVKAQYDEFYLQHDFPRFPRSERAFIRALVRRYSIRAGAGVVDLGCGTGRYARLLVDIGCDVTAVDLSETAIAAVRRLVPEARTAVADLRRLPFAPGCFDVVFASGVSLFNTDRLEDLRPLVDHFASLLRPGGLLVFVKTSSLTNRPSRRKSRIDYDVDSFAAVFAHNTELTRIGRHALFPQLFTMLGPFAFAGPFGAAAQAVTRLTGLPLRVYLLYRREVAPVSVAGPVAGAPTMKV